MHPMLNIAVKAARRAGSVINRAARNLDVLAVREKAANDFVTEVDTESEQAIIRTLLEAYPKHSILAEESGATNTDIRSEFQWIIDPLDGTTNFLHGFPAYAVSIAAAVDGVLEAGVVLHVPLDRLSHATRGGGAWEGETRIRVSPITDPEHALIGTGFPFRDFSALGTYLDQLGRIAATATGVRRPGSAAIDLADVAAGRFDGFWEQRLSAWDIAAGCLLVREAGGHVTDPSGRELGIEHGPVVAGNQAIHPWLLRILADPGPRGSPGGDVRG